MAKRGLPTGISMRHDSHYVEELARSNRSIGKILPIDKIEPNPDQPRTEIGDLTELTNSIKEKGVLEPLLVKPNKDGTWMIIAGERRWRASNLAGLKEVPCIELDLDENSVAEIALIENLQRKDLTIWEEADGLAALSNRFGYKHEEIAKKIGKSRTTVTECLTIAGIPDSIREKCRVGNITAKSTLLEIARQFDDASMHNFVDNISSQNLTREEIRQTARPQLKPIVEKSEKSRLKVKERLDPIITNNFTYQAEDNSFTLNVNFNKSFEKRDVLRALKEAFESVKGSSSS
ncbi:MAG: ParB/RepB/Spo0J family partition protein [Pyrinomonadaceae bacterium]|nr:ParB/RepB/Spo0J family partition protein [Pyrinomonadaceae bacterium]